MNGWIIISRELQSKNVRHSADLATLERKVAGQNGGCIRDGTISPTMYVRTLHDVVMLMTLMQTGVLALLVIEYALNIREINHT
jgi:hypothetical protein